MNRPKGIIKISNEYAELFEDYNKIPKSVFAAVCASMILRGNEKFEDVHDLFLKEWQALYDNHIVSQKPNFRYDL